MLKGSECEPRAQSSDNVEIKKAGGNAKTRSESDSARIRSVTSLNDTTQDKRLACPVKGETRWNTSRGRNIQNATKWGTNQRSDTRASDTLSKPAVLR